MRIFVFSPTYPNEKNIVANIFVKEQVRALIKLGYEVIVLTIDKEPTKKVLHRIDKSIRVIVEQEVIITKSQKTFCESKLHFINQLLINKTFSVLYKYAKKNYGNPDIIYAHFMSAAYAAINLNIDIPIVTFEHSGNLMNKKISKFENKCLGRVLDNSTRYIATSDRLKASILEKTNGNKEIIVVPNMVDDMFVYHKYIKDNNFSFFSLCRFETDKRLDLLIEAFCTAFGEKENVSLIIGGTGKEFDRIQQLIDKMQRNNQIKLLGRLNRVETLEQYKKCACFVLASRHETFGMVWREALCVGRPIITTNHGGFSHNDFNESFGVMVEPDNKKELIKALVYVKNNFDEYDLQQISRNNVEMYSSTIIAKKIEKILLEAIEK